MFKPMDEQSTGQPKTAQATPTPPEMNEQADEDVLKVFLNHGNDKITLPLWYLELVVHANNCKRNKDDDKCIVSNCDFMKEIIKLKLFNSSIIEKLALNEKKEGKNPVYRKRIEREEQRNDYSTGNAARRQTADYAHPRGRMKMFKL